MIKRKNSELNALDGLFIVLRKILHARLGNSLSYLDINLILIRIKGEFLSELLNEHIETARGN